MGFAKITAVGKRFSLQPLFFKGIDIMYMYTIGTELDIEDTIKIDYEAFSCKGIESKRRYHSMLACYKKNPEGLVLAKDNKNKTVGFIYSRRLGVLGWCGPMAVLPEYGSKGIASELLKKATEILIKAGCETIGFETTPDLMNYYMKKRWIATGITYFFRYSYNGLDVGSCNINIQNSQVDNTNVLERVRLNNGLDFFNEVYIEKKMKKLEILDICKNNKKIGLIMLEVTNECAVIKLLIDYDKSIDYSVLLKILADISNYFNKRDVVFPVNTENMILVNLFLNNNCAISGYSIRFQAPNFKLLFNDDQIIFYHWGT